MGLLDEVEAETNATKGPRSQVDKLMESLSPEDAADLKASLQKAKAGQVEYSAILRVLERRGILLGDAQCLSRWARKNLD